MLKPTSEAMSKLLTKTFNLAIYVEVTLSVFWGNYLYSACTVVLIDAML